MHNKKDLKTWKFFITVQQLYDESVKGDITCAYRIYIFSVKKTIENTREFLSNLYMKDRQIHGEHLF